MGGDDGSEVSQVAKEVDNLLSRSKYVEALQCALRDPPFAAKDQALKVSSWNGVCTVSELSG